MDRVALRADGIQELHAAGRGLRLNGGNPLVGTGGVSGSGAGPLTTMIQIGLRFSRNQELPQSSPIVPVGLGLNRGQSQVGKDIPTGLGVHVRVQHRIRPVLVGEHFVVDLIGLRLSADACDRFRW